jgi:hypothetical protein
MSERSEPTISAVPETHGRAITATTSTLHPSAHDTMVHR